MASTALRCRTLCTGKPLMNRRAIVAALCGLALLLTSPPAFSANLSFSVTLTPPAPIVETVPPPPAPGTVWAPGYWRAGTVSNTSGCRGSTSWRRSPMHCGSVDGGFTAAIIGRGWTGVGGAGEANRSTWPAWVDVGICHERAPTYALRVVDVRTAHWRGPLRVQEHRHRHG